MDLREAIEAITKRISDLFTFGVDSDLPGLALDPEDLHVQLTTHRSGFFMGLFDEESARQRLERQGVLRAIRKRVKADVRVRLSPEEGILRIFRADCPEGPEALVAEVKARFERAAPPHLRDLGFPPGDLLVLDWLLMQNPGCPFPPGRGPLPGQRYPGLGLGEHVIDVIRRTAVLLRASGVLGIPMYYHGAIIYHRIFVFADPAVEGRFQALTRDLKGLPFEEATRAVHEGRVHDATFDEPFFWQGEEMIWPLSDSMRAYLSEPRYVDAAARALMGTRFVVVAR